MKSRYNSLRTIGTLALILAWVILILGILAGVASWIGLRSVQNLLNGFDLNVSLGPLPILGVLPGLLWGILGFLVYYAIGKTLHLLVDVDERTIQLRQSADQPAVASDSLTEASGEMKRQAKLIAANLEATQDIQRQLASLESRLGVSTAVVPAAAAGTVAAVAAAEQSAKEAVGETSADVEDAAAAASDAVDDAANAVEDAVDG